jgi:hypothetical protein
MERAVALLVLLVPGAPTKHPAEILSEDRQAAQRRRFLGDSRDQPDAAALHQ